MLDIELLEPYSSIPSHSTLHSSRTTRDPKLPTCPGKKTQWLAMAGKAKWWLAPLSQGREKGVHAATQAKQMGTCWTSGVDLLLTPDEAGGFWCPFSCWFSFSPRSWAGQSGPSSSLLQVLVSHLSDCLILDQTKRNSSRKNKTESKGKGKNPFLLKLAKN